MSPQKSTNVLSTAYMVFIDELGNEVDLIIEEASRALCYKYIKPTDHVLEFGARYGTVSVFLSKMLDTGTQLVSVEPDSRVWDCLERNAVVNDASFHIIKGVVSPLTHYLVQNQCVWEQKTYMDKGSFPEHLVHEVKNYTVDSLQEQFKLKFNVLVADCEGYLMEFFEHHKWFIAGLDTLIYEEDCVEWHRINDHFVDYRPLEEFLISCGFVMREDYVDNIGLHNKVWTRVPGQTVNLFV